MNSIELLRKHVIDDLMLIPTMQKVWPFWRDAIFKDIEVDQITGPDIIKIGNRLSEIFKLIA